MVDTEMETALQLGTPAVLQAYERAVDETLISSITDHNGTILYANKRFCEISQYSTAELIGQTHRIVHSAHHPKSFFKQMWAMISHGHVWHDEIRNKAKDGTFYWVDTVIVPIRADKGEITHFLSLRTLVTARKDLEAEKERYLNSLEMLLVMTAHRVKKPLAACLSQITQLDTTAPLDEADRNALVESLRATALELDGFTQQLSTFLRDR